MGDPEALSPSFQSMPSNPQESQISTEGWLVAEEIANDILLQIQPTADCEEKRRSIIDYVMRLTRRNLKIEVLPVGSVPLKTYLSAGDIDLTALGRPGSEADMVESICSILQSEERNKHAEFVVKDVCLINAEVKLIKCIINGIMVDISINQLGGLCTLCFLELIDRYISKQHLFKRSIILVKAWCYYESRTLGAHHGLISTYALETLVMCIFHLFHSSLNGPLAVLHKFMDYFSTFDWDNYGITMYGPVPLSSPQGLIAEENESGLFNQDDIKNAVELFSAPLKAYENNSQKLTWKYLNIVDPLKEHNNIGRSVSQGNLYRIRSAFTYGMGMLNQILLLPKDEIAKELSMFFANIIEISSEGGRPGCEINGVSPASLQIEALDQETSPSSSSSNSKFDIDHAWKINPTPQPSCTNLIEDLCYRINIMEVSDRKLPSSSSYQAATELFGFSKEALLPAKQILGVANSRLYGSRINDEDDHILENAEDKAERSEVSLIHWSFLGGDYDLHHRSLLFAICSLQSCGAIISSSMHQWHKMYMHLNATSFGPGLPFYPPGYYQVVSPYLSWRLEDTPRHRGTGTFIPPVQMSYSAYKERLAAWVPRSRHTRHGSQKNKLVRGGGNRKSFQPLRRPPQYYSLQQLEHFNQGWSYSFPSSFTAPIEWHPPVSVSCGEQAPELLYTPPPPQRPYQLKDDEEFPALPGRRQQQ